ncbi:thioredoxin domain-containing protein [Pseudanabaena yagii]|uniref:Uncharacterized protein n=1 Tax=Pseudanabaena yagii GIHE-NHR1 TaxID=2722753 RepID=A0ABX1LN12_9CYAN|nr:hypothetical protein [Pseudanabaena yagii]NMF56456.1 hypothetical protein [Pseudanabaena yagii GIHE-NHR1]
MLVKKMSANSWMISIGLGAITLANIATPQARAEQPIVDNLVQQAASKDQATSQLAIAKLREFKNAGVDAFWATYQKDLPNNSQLRATLDAICQQKDCDASRLYWYKDLEAAKTASKETGKPILSLRLLGNLADELSCANSRFFRTALYPNAEVSQLLRDRFILHWQSERPVPKVTIDFGDGRKLEQTITGNSIHYILDSEGRPIDAIPGLYSPQAFIENLKDAEGVARSLQSNNSDAHRREVLVNYHRDRYAKLEKKWRADLTRLRLPLQPLLPLAVTDPKASAAIASRLTVSKMMVELPTLSRTVGEPLTELNPSSPFDKLSDANWARLASLYQNRVYLDQGSLKLMERKISPTASMRTVVNSFEKAIAQDTVRNEYVFHAQIHNWFAKGDFVNSDSASLSALNRRVYDQLFLTPASDPWLGLVNENIYTGISSKSE